MDGKMDLNSTYSLHITEDIIFQILIFLEVYLDGEKMPQEAVTLKIKGKELPVYKLTHAVTRILESGGTGENPRDQERRSRSRGA